MAQTWDPSFNSSLTYSAGNLTATATTNSFSNVRGTVSLTSGKIYWETVATLIIATPDYSIGICNPNHGPTVDYLGQDVSSFGWFGSFGVYHNGSNVASGTNYLTGDVIGQALDLGAKTLSYYKNGTLAYSGIDISTLIVDSAAVFPAAEPNFSTEVVTGRFEISSWAFAPPSGFGPWVTSSFAEFATAAFLIPSF